MIGIDFEAAPKTEGINSWNTHHTLPIEVGLYSLKTGNTYSSTINETVHFTDWHKNNTPHLTPEILQKSKPRCKVAEEVSTFLHKECADVSGTGQCKMLTYGESDYTWFHKLFENCKAKQDLDITRRSLFDDKRRGWALGRINLDFINVQEIAFKYKPLIKGGYSLANLVKIQLPTLQFKNHNALEDAKAVALLADTFYKDLDIEKM